MGGLSKNLVLDANTYEHASHNVTSMLRRQVANQGERVLPSAWIARIDILVLDVGFCGIP